MNVPVLRLRAVLLVSIQSELSDSDWRELQHNLLILGGEAATRGAIIDVTGMDSIDSYAGRALNSIAHTLRFRGLRTIVVGIPPDVAFSMVRLGLRFEGFKKQRWTWILAGSCFRQTESGWNNMLETHVVRISTDSDIVVARQKGRLLSAEIGFRVMDHTLIATAISEIARNILVHAGTGEISIAPTDMHGRKGIIIVASDTGPGIPNIENAMQDGFTTGDGLGLGLPGARRLMDELEIESTVGVGTIIRMYKWVQ